VKEGFTWEVADKAAAIADQAACMRCGQ